MDGTSSDKLEQVIKTSDGGMLGVGHFDGEQLYGTNNTGNGEDDGMLIKYNRNCEIEWLKTIGGEKEDYITSVAQTEDNGYIIGGYFLSDIQLGNGNILENDSGYDGMIIKYNEFGDIQWAQSTTDGWWDYITSITATSDGGCIATGYYRNGSIEGTPKGIIIKYNKDGGIEWKNILNENVSGYVYPINIFARETENRDYIVVSDFNGECSVGNTTLKSKGSQDIAIIKYSSTGEVIWAKSIGGDSKESVTEVIQTIDGKFIMTGNFNSTSIIINETKKLENNTNNSAGMMISFNSDGVFEYVSTILSTSTVSLEAINSTEDGGYVLVGYFNGIISSDNNKLLENNNAKENLGFLIKMNSSMKIEKAYTQNIVDVTSVLEIEKEKYIVAGSLTSNKFYAGNTILDNYGSSDAIIAQYSEGEMSSTQINHINQCGGNEDDYINELIQTKDGGFFIGGDYESDYIELSDSIKIENNSSISYGSKYSDGMVAKYDKNLEVIWARTIGSRYEDYIKDVTETSDGQLVAVGYFNSSSTKSIIDLDGIRLIGTCDSNGMIIKFDEIGNVKWAKMIEGDNSNYIRTVDSTKDGGIIVAGYFYGKIKVGNIELTTTGIKKSFLIKYDKDGNVEWAKNFDELNDAQIETYNNDSFILFGRTISDSKGKIFKFNKNGEVTWRKELGESITNVNITTDGGFILGGSFSGTLELDDIKLESNNSRNTDGMIIKFDKNDKAVWGTTLSYNTTTYIDVVKQTANGNYIAIGGSGNNVKIGESTLSGQKFIVKYDSNGNIQLVDALKAKRKY